MSGVPSGERGNWAWWLQPIDWLTDDAPTSTSDVEEIRDQQRKCNEQADIHRPNLPCLCWRSHVTQSVWNKSLRSLWSVEGIPPQTPQPTITVTITYDPYLPKCLWYIELIPQTPLPTKMSSIYWADTTLFLFKLFLKISLFDVPGCSMFLVLTTAKIILVPCFCH